MIRHYLALLFVVTFGVVSGQSEQRSMSDMANLLSKSLVSGEFDTLSHYLPNKDDVEYYVDVAVDLKPDVFGEPANRQRLMDRFTDHSHLVAREFRASFDSISSRIAKDSLQFAESSVPSVNSRTESGITEGFVTIPLQGEQPTSIRLILSLTKRGWTWSSMELISNDTTKP